MEINNLSKDRILSQYSEKDIFIRFAIKHHMKIESNGDLPKRKVSSPFAPDKDPSFRFYPENGSQKYKCGSSGKQGDVWQFVADLNEIDCKLDFKKVLEVIASEMNIVMNNNKRIENKPKTIGKSSVTETQPPLQAPNEKNASSSKKLIVSKREFTPLDLEYWNKLGVKLPVLQKFNIYSISNYCWSEKKPIYTKKECVAFAIDLDGQIKLYVPNQPNAGIKKNVLPAFKTGIYGFEQLGTEKKEAIIICAGEKDTIVANSRGFNAVTFGSESGHPKPEQIELLMQHCNTLFVCYDNDEAGEKGRNALVKRFQSIIPLQLPENQNIKGYDITDYFQDHNASDFQKIIDLALENKVIITGEKSKLSIVNQYELPKEVTIPFSELESDVANYGLFQANNKIYIARGKLGKQYFESISNFQIEILQHIQDEKFPLKLLKIKNVFSLEKIFDMHSDRFNKLGTFEDSIACQGNFLFTGSPSDFKVLKAYLFDKMGNGQKIETLGFQNGFNFWVWNNKVNLMNGQSIEIDENGIFSLNKKSFYVPSANRIYSNNIAAFQPQKKMKIISSDNKLHEYLQKILEVHKSNSISAILFTLSSIFQDIVVKEIGNFPILFLYGAGSTGKDQLIECCQSFFGEPQSAINVESGASTIKGQIRKFAQFTNLIVHLSEYKRGDSKLDGILKGFWDRRGYEFGTIESKVSTDTVPVLSSTILAGNDYPEAEALISRLLWLEFPAKTFSAADSKPYEELKDMTKKGISHFTDDLLLYRDHYEKNFRIKYRMYKENLTPMIPVQHTRVIGNLSVLGATYEIFKDIITFPFSYGEMIEHFKKCTENQNRKLDSSSIGNKFWDCFLASMRGNKDDRIVVFRDLRLDSNILYFQFTSCFNKIQRQWALQYRETSPNKQTIQDYLKKQDYFRNEVSSVRFGKGKDSKNTSGYVIDISKLQIQEELINAVEWQICEQPQIPVENFN